VRRVKRAVFVALVVVGCTRRRDEGAQAVRDERKPSSTERPGCVDAREDAEKRLFAGEKMKSLYADAELVVQREIDLDGDGALDPFVTSTVSCGSGGCDWVIYVEHATGCARYVGQFWGEPTALERQPSGWVDVQLDSHGGYQMLEWIRYAGDRYRAYRIKRCPWGDPTPPFDAAPDAEDGCEEWHTPTDADY
jgi:hypothetical protein